jgi:uncharacterized protein
MFEIVFAHATTPYIYCQCHSKEIVEQAEEVFAGQVLTIADTRRDYGEPRYITLGSLRGRVVVIVHTPRGSSTRIVSMRKANERERASY